MYMFSFFTTTTTPLQLRRHSSNSKNGLEQDVPQSISWLCIWLVNV